MNEYFYFQFLKRKRRERKGVGEGEKREGWEGENRNHFASLANWLDSCIIKCDFERKIEMTWHNIL